MVGCDFTLRTLQALVTRRRQLVEMRKQEATRLKQTHGNVARTDIRSLVAILDRRIQKIEAQIATLITTNPDLADTARRVQTVPGVGLIVAATLLIEMPELGTLDAKQAASLAGLAPITRQSGRWNGRARIQGGRGNLRQALYVPALVAARFNPDLAATYRQLVEASKPAKVAITAIMRKLIILANTLLRENRNWTPKRA